MNQNATELTDYRCGQPVEFAWRQRVFAQTTITGFELLTRAVTPQPITIPTALYLTDASGVPLATAAATSTMRVDTQLAFYSTQFTPPVTGPAGAFFCVAFSAPEPSVLAPEPLTGTGVTFFNRGPCIAPAWNQFNGVLISYRVRCSGAGGGGALPRLANSDLPSPGRSFTVRLEAANPNGLAVLLTGLARTSIDLTPLGAVGCNLLSSGELQIGLPVNSGGSALLAITVPNLAVLVSQRLYQQFGVADPINALGIVATNGGLATIGLLP